MTWHNKSQNNVRLTLIAQILREAVGTQEMGFHAQVCTA